MRIYRIGIEGGRPARGTIGAQPEWFYKGTGAILWETDLGAGTTGAPMTYALNRRQFIVVAVGSSNHPAELVALALP